MWLKIGWIFTDLESEGNGKVAYKRNVVRSSIGYSIYSTCMHFRNIKIVSPPPPSSLSLSLSLSLLSAHSPADSWRVYYGSWFPEPVSQSMPTQQIRILWFKICDCLYFRKWEQPHRSHKLPGSTIQPSHTHHHLCCSSHTHTHAHTHTLLGIQSVSVSCSRRLPSADFRCSRAWLHQRINVWAICTWCVL